MQAKGLFEELLEDDPHRLDSMDIYSNILCVNCLACRVCFCTLLFFLGRYDPFFDCVQVRPRQKVGPQLPGTPCCENGQVSAGTGRHSVRESILHYEQPSRRRSAHHVVTPGRYRAETCCIVGNYYRCLCNELSMSATRSSSVVLTVRPTPTASSRSM